MPDPIPPGLAATALAAHDPATYTVAVELGPLTPHTAYLALLALERHITAGLDDVDTGLSRWAALELDLGVAAIAEAQPGELGRLAALNGIAGYWHPTHALARTEDLRTMFDLVAGPIARAMPPHLRADARRDSLARRIDRTLTRGEAAARRLATATPLDLGPTPPPA